MPKSPHPLCKSLLLRSPDGKEAVEFFWSRITGETVCIHHWDEETQTARNITMAEANFIVKRYEIEGGS